MAKKYIGIDIGSTASKVCVLEEGCEPMFRDCWTLCFTVHQTR